MKMCKHSTNEGKLYSLQTTALVLFLLTDNLKHLLFLGLGPAGYGTRNIPPGLLGVQLANPPSRLLDLSVSLIM